MQAIILAAGYGKRLQPITNEIPKSLVEVNGIPLIINALDQLSVHDINEVIIVTGHMKNKIISRVGHNYRDMRITYVENPLYGQTNNVYSLFLAMNYISEDILLLECDLFYNRNLISAININNGSDCNILVSKYNTKTMDGTVVECDEDYRVKSLIISRDQGEDYDYSNKYKTVNVYKFSYDFIKNKFMPAIDLYIRTQSVNSYYELVLGTLIYYGNSDIKMINIDESEWCEIDDINDLELARKKFTKMHK